MRRNGNFSMMIDVGEKLGGQKSYESSKVEFLAIWNQDKKQWKIKNDYIHAYFWQSKEDPFKCDHKVLWSHPKYGDFAHVHMTLGFRLTIEEHLYLRGGMEPSFTTRQNSTDIRAFV